MEPRYLIYALVDPRDGAWRYIGKSEMGMKRPYQHGTSSFLRRDTNRHKANWINQLHSAGLDYDVLVLETTSAPARLAELEIEWIAAAKSAGVRLTNKTDGGEGCRGRASAFKGKSTGRKHTDETKKALSDAKVGARNPMYGKHHDEDFKQRLRRRFAGVSRPHDNGLAIWAAKGGRMILDVDSGAIYRTQREAANAVGSYQSLVGKVLGGYRKSAGGHRFKYIDHQEAA